MCTRVVYLGDNDRVVTGRSMDWKTEVGTNLWAFPRCISRSGQAGPGSVEWTSEYGSVVATGFDICTTDGFNDEVRLVELSAPTTDWSRAADELPVKFASPPYVAVIS